MIQWLGIANLFCCFFLTGLIWVIQLLHYPSFSFVGADKFASFHAFHSLRISMIVMPTMTLELISSATLLYAERNRFWFSQSVLVLFIWLCTAFLSVPIHNRLAFAANQSLMDRLVLTNWPRTLFWSARSLSMLYWLSSRLIVAK